MQPKKTVFMFSGQGSQYYQMGKALFDGDAEFRGHSLRLNDLARNLGATNVLEATHGGAKADDFDRTSLTHPAIFMIEYALALRLIASGVVPDAVLGASLGTFAAAAIAGCIGEADAMRAVIAQAQAFESACEPGGMIAILAEPALYDQAPFLHRGSELAAINFAKHFCIAARRAELDAIETELGRRSIAHQRLAVSFAFHSRWVDDARDRFLDSIDAVALNSASLPLMCCDLGGPIDRALSRDDFWRVARRPIRFFDTIRTLEEKGPWRYVDVGPSGTMATFVKYALPAGSASTTHSILTPYGQDLKNLSVFLATAA
jgi:bacillaene synthase trans-acting acyltransferase